MKYITGNIKKNKKIKDLTVEDVFDLWKQAVKEGKIKISENTRKNSIANCNKHIIPLIGNEKIRKLNINNIEKYFNKLTENGTSEKTLYNIFTDIKKLTNFALEKEFIFQNPFEKFVIKQPKPGRIPVNVMSFNEYERIVQNDRNKQSYYYNAIIFLAETGLRAGELAIKKTDYHTTESGIVFVTINKSIVRTLGDDDKTSSLRVVNSVKNDISYRIVPLNTYAQNAVKRQLQYCEEHNIFSPFIFCTSTGSLIEQRNLLRTLHCFCQNANVEKKGLHSLRKLYINHTLKNGIAPFDLAKITGHSVQTIFKYYHSIDDDILQKIVSASELR